VILNTPLYFVYPLSLHQDSLDTMIHRIGILIKHPSCSAFRDYVVYLHLADNSIDNLVRAALATQVRCGDLALQQDAVDSGVDSCGRRGVAQVREQQCSGPEIAASIIIRESGVMELT
jgi:hypothetical protein